MKISRVAFFFLRYYAMSLSGLEEYDVKESVRNNS